MRSHYHPTAERSWIYAWCSYGAYIGCRAFASKASALRAQRDSHAPGRVSLVLNADNKADLDTWHHMARTGWVG